MGDTRQNPYVPEALATLSGGDRSAEPEDFRKSLVYALLAHLTVFAMLLVGPLTGVFWDQESVPGTVQIRFREVGGEGEGGGGGGGGRGGERISAFIRPRAEPEPETQPEPRQAAIASRKPRQLSFDELNVPDLPTETDQLFAGVFSPDETEFPGLSLDDMRDFGGVDTRPSSGTGGGIGGGQGTGTGTGEGWGVGPGRGGGFGGGDYSPGAWDIDPVLVFEPPDPAYPPIAREKMVGGEVILRVLVKTDGSTEILNVVKSLPYCVEAAKEHAKLYRWKPALKEGKPVEAFGIISVTFDIFTPGPTKS